VEKAQSKQHLLPSFLLHMTTFSAVGVLSRFLQAKYVWFIVLKNKKYCLMPVLHRQHGQDKTVLSYLVHVGGVN